jgi:Sec-independent protein translocase protein TatA
MIGVWEVVAISIVAFIVYKLGKDAPSIAKNAGKSVAEFKAGLREIPDAIKEVKEEIKK